MKSFSFFLFLLSFGTAVAQKPCEKFSIYFEVNQSELSDNSTKTLHQLINKLEGTEYLIELYGYADSTASTEYNLALSQKRIDSVKYFLNKVESIQFNYFETNLGEEENAENEDLALSRRVDIYVLPVSDGKIVIKDGNAEVKVPLDYFSPCGACQSQPKIDAYYTVEEARAANIEFVTSGGVPLISDGTFDFNFTPCNESLRESSKEPICFVVTRSKLGLDPQMSLWEPEVINGITYWNSINIKIDYDSERNTYEFCVTSPTINIDKPNIGDIFKFPIELNDRRSEFTGADPSDLLKTTEDSVRTNSYFRVNSFGNIGDTYFHFNKPRDEFPINKTNTMEIQGRTIVVSNEYIVDIEMYEQLIFSEVDTSLLIKLRNKPVQVGYYLRDVQQFIPFEWNKKNKRFYGQKPKGEFELAYLKKRDRLYVLPNEKLELKYKRFRKIYKPKFRLKYYKRFKREKMYTQKKQEWGEFLGTK